VQSVGGSPFKNLILWTLLRCHGPEDINICWFLEWVEAFPVQIEKAWEVARCLLKEIIPWFRIPVSIGSDDGPIFVAEVLQLVAKGLEITWNLYTVCPHSSGKVKCMNRTLKLQLKKLCQKTHLQWINYCQ
jgi:hypothetical protein